MVAFIGVLANTSTLSSSSRSRDHSEPAFLILGFRSGPSLLLQHELRVEMFLINRWPAGSGTGDRTVLFALEDLDTTLLR
jgi:hypothetical protein